MDVTLIPTDTLTAELARRFPHGCFGGACEWARDTEQHRGEVWGNPLVVLGLLDVLHRETLAAMTEGLGPARDSA